jgi:curved DNA-binding protein CbpA
MGKRQRTIAKQSCRFKKERVMYPFFILDVPLDATNKDVKQRYDELVRRYPPDRFPTRFQTIRKAFEQLRTEEDRRKTFLSYYDKAVRIDANAVPDTSPRPRRRLSSDALAQIMIDTITDDDR